MTATRPLALAALLLSAAAARAGDGPIQDNSFLLEEAYNQEPGVIQHVGFFTRDRESGDWLLAFTDEWPAPGQAHQLSLTVPLARVQDAAAGVSRTGLGDVALNYRWQALGDGGAPVAVAPRLSVVFPTGDPDRGLGTGSMGLQANLPISAALGSRFVGHFNAGVTWTPDVEGSGDQVGVNLGQGLVWLLHPRLNLLVELAFQHDEVDTRLGTESSQALVVSPGIRGAIDLGELQIVPGLAVPLGIGPSSGERAFLAYLSFEHPMWKPRE